MLNKIVSVKSKSELVRSIGNSKLDKFVVVDDVDVNRMDIIRRELIKFSPNNRGRKSIVIMSFKD